MGNKADESVGTKILLTAHNGQLRAKFRYSVNVFPSELKKLDEEEHAIKEVQEGAGIYYLDERYYSPDFGLSLTPVNKMSFLDS